MVARKGRRNSPLAWLQNRSVAFRIGPLRGFKILMFDEKTTTRRETLIEMSTSPPQTSMKDNAISVVVINEIKAMNGPTI
jgi:hypothetical protein